MYAIGPLITRPDTHGGANVVVSQQGIKSNDTSGSAQKQETIISIGANSPCHSWTAARKRSEAILNRWPGIPGAMAVSRYGRFETTTPTQQNPAPRSRCRKLSAGGAHYP